MRISAPFRPHLHTELWQLAILISRVISLLPLKGNDRHCNCSMFTSLHMIARSCRRTLSAIGGKLLTAPK